MWRKLRERSKARRASKAAPSSSHIPESVEQPSVSHQFNDFDETLDPAAPPLRAPSESVNPVITRSPSLPQATASTPAPAAAAVSENARARTDMGTRADTSVGRPTTPASAAPTDASIPDTSETNPLKQPPSTSVTRQQKPANVPPSVQPPTSAQQQTLPPQTSTTPTASANNAQLDDSTASGIVTGTNRRTPSLNLSVVSEYAPVNDPATNVNGTLSIDNPHHPLQQSQTHHHHDRYRRLSLDGDLPPSAIRPDERTNHVDAGHGDERNVVGDEEDVEENDELEESHSEGVFKVDTSAILPSIIDVAACSKAGWEPMRSPIPSMPSTHTVEVRKENQDAYCVYVPFLPGALGGDLSSSQPVVSSNDEYNQTNVTSISPQLATAVKKGPLQMFLGVFDGHGAQGRPIAHYARDFISVVCRESAAQLDPSAFQSSINMSPTSMSSSVHHKQQHHRTSLGFSGNQNPSVLSKSDPTAHRARLDTLRAAFSRAERALTESDCGIDHVFSGTTAVVSWLFGRELYTAWTGDSRGVIGRIVSPSNSSSSNSSASIFSDGGNPLHNGRVKFRAIDLSHDQKPSRGDEKRRVRAAGGRIARWQRNMGPLRVWLPREWTPGLAMTRSIGDTVLSEYGVCPVPEVSYTTVGPSDSFIVLASDGVWEFMTSQEVVDLVGRARREGHSAEDASELLVSEAVRRWRRNEVVVDDTTAVVMYMRWSHDDTAVDHGGGGGLERGGDPSISASSNPHAFATGSDKKSEPLFTKSRNILSRTRAKVSLKGGPVGVYLVTDTGHLADFVCKNDSFQGV